MFRASSAHPQEVNVVNCTCVQPLVFSFSAGGRLVHLLREELYYDARPNKSQENGGYSSSYNDYKKQTGERCFGGTRKRQAKSDVVLFVTVNFTL